MMQLTQEYLKTLFDYNPDTGVLTWKWRSGVPKEWNTKYAGQEAGSIFYPSGCARKLTGVNGKRYLNTRLIWLWYYGEPIPIEIDHKDRNSLNDSIINLRAATSSQNSMNQKIRIDNTSGVKGVFWHKTSSKWIARIRVNGQLRYLGLFNTIEEAIKIRQEAANKIYGEYANESAT